MGQPMLQVLSTLKHIWVIGWIINIMVTLYGLVRSWNKLSIWSMACHQESRPQILKHPSYHDVISTLHCGFQWTSELRTALATKSPDFEREDKWNFIKGCLDWGPLVCQIVGFVGMLENQVVSKPKRNTGLLRRRVRVGTDCSGLETHVRHW